MAWKLSDAAIELQHELTTGYHPHLVQLLARTDDPQIKIAELAAWVGIELDSAYTPEELDVIFTAITERLIKHHRTNPLGLITIN